MLLEGIMILDILQIKQKLRQIDTKIQETHKKLQKITKKYLKIHKYSCILTLNSWMENSSAVKTI